MPLVPAKCPICGALLNIESEKEAAVCQSCGNAFVVEKAINNYHTYNNIVNNITTDAVVVQNESEKEQLNKNGETYIKIGSFGKAQKYYEELVERFPDDYRGWWGVIRCKIQYNKDYVDKTYTAYQCTKCKALFNSSSPKCPSCNAAGSMTLVTFFSKEQGDDLRYYLCVLKKFAPDDAYAEYKKIVDHFLHIRALENANEDATRKKGDFLNAKSNCEESIASIRRSLKKKKEIINTEHFRINEAKQNYEHQKLLVDQCQIVDVESYLPSNDPIGIYNSAVKQVDEYRRTYEQASKKMIPYKALLGAGIAFAFLSVFGAESLILAIIFLWLYWWLGDFSRSRYKEAKRRLNSSNSNLANCAESAKSRLKMRYDSIVATIHENAEKARKDIEDKEKQIISQENAIEMYEKLLSFSDDEIRNFYLSVWHNWFELEPISYDKRIDEYLMPKR